MSVKSNAPMAVSVVEGYFHFTCFGFLSQYCIHGYIRLLNQTTPKISPGTLQKIKTWLQLQQLEFGFKILISRIVLFDT